MIKCKKNMTFEECEMAVLRSSIDKIDKKKGEEMIGNPQVVKITVKAMEAFGQMQTKIRIYDLLDPANDVDHWHQKEGKSVPS